MEAIMWRQRGSIAVVPFSDHGMSDQRSVDRAGKSSRVQVDAIASSSSEEAVGRPPPTGKRRLLALAIRLI